MKTGMIFPFIKLNEKNIYLLDETGTECVLTKPPPPETKTIVL